MSEGACVWELRGCPFSLLPKHSALHPEPRRVLAGPSRMGVPGSPSPLVISPWRALGLELRSLSGPESTFRPSWWALGRLSVDFVIENSFFDVHFSAIRRKTLSENAKYENVLRTNYLLCFQHF